MAQIESDVSIRKLVKRFGTMTAVDGIDLEVPRGAFVVLVGPSGCGKTTTLRMIGGFEQPDEGRILLRDNDVTGLPPNRRNVNMVFQHYALFPHMSIGDNIAFGMRLARVRKPEQRERIAEMLKIVRLEGLEKRKPAQLSGGQQQRVALARALAPSPQVILLDEPFSNLDATLRDRLRREMRQILRRAEVTALFVTHDQEEALSLADRVTVMRDGRVEQTGTPEEIYARPATRWAATFLGETELLPGTAGRGFVDCELQRLPVDPGFEGLADVMIRPECVGVGTGHDGAEAVVVGRTFYGHDQLLELELASGLRLRSRRLGFPSFHPGDHVRVFAEGPVNVLPRS